MGFWAWLASIFVHKERDQSPAIRQSARGLANAQRSGGQSRVQYARRSTEDAFLEEESDAKTVVLSGDHPLAQQIRKRVEPKGPEALVAEERNFSEGHTAAIDVSPLDLDVYGVAPRRPSPAPRSRVTSGETAVIDTSRLKR
jgi:hypothetical protein